jgi:hypothetical protein
MTLFREPMMRALLFLCFLVASLPPGEAARGAADQDEGTPEARVPEALGGRDSASTLLQRFQNSWERQDLDDLLSLLSERAKVIMKLEFLKLDGEYGKGQAGYIMKDFFERGGGKRFTISRYRELSGGESAYAAGDLAFRDSKSGLEMNLRIFISLEETEGRWSIEEIRINER